MKDKLKLNIRHNPFENWFCWKKKSESMSGWKKGRKIDFNSIQPA